MPHLNPYCRKHQQLELLPDTSSSDSFDPSSDTPVEGFADFKNLCQLERPHPDLCPTCGGRGLTIAPPGNQIHAARVECSDCARFERWASKKFLQALINHSHSRDV